MNQMTPTPGNRSNSQLFSECRRNHARAGSTMLHLDQKHYYRPLQL